MASVCSRPECRICIIVCDGVRNWRGRDFVLTIDKKDHLTRACRRSKEVGLKVSEDVESGERRHRDEHGHQQLYSWNDGGVEIGE